MVGQNPTLARSAIATDMLRLLLERQGITVGATIVNVDNHWIINDVHVSANVTVVNAHADGVDYLFKLSTAGRHLAQSAVDALAATVAYGADPLTATMDIAHWQPRAGQGRCDIVVTDMANDGESLTLIDCSDVANAEVLASSFEVLARAKPTDDVGRIVKGRRIAILGAPLAGSADLQLLDQMHCVGPDAAQVWAGLAEERQGLCVDRATDIAAQIARIVDAGDVVLVIGPKDTNLGVIVDAIKKLGHRRSQEQ